MNLFARQMEIVETLLRSVEEREANKVPDSEPHPKEVRADILAQRSACLLVNIGDSISERMDVSLSFFRGLLVLEGLSEQEAHGAYS